MFYHFNKLDIDLNLPPLSLSQTVTVFETVESSVDPYICTFIVGVVQLAATGSKLAPGSSPEILKYCLTQSRWSWWTEQAGGLFSSSPAS